MHCFDRPGIFDPIDDRKHAVTIKSFNDFGLISISYNPFSNEDFYVITVAGIHGIATAHGVKLLSNKKSFEERPFGGIYEVQFPEYGFWYEKLKNAQVKWQTKPYHKKYTSIAAILELIKQRSNNLINKEYGFFISSPFNQESTYLIDLNKKLESICEDFFSSTKTAYSIKAPGKGTFPKVIEERVKGSTAIVHILNDYKPGVLFEIGLSLGYKKHTFLLWDNSLTKFNSTNLPDLIEKISVIEIDSSNDEHFKDQVLEHIINPSIEISGDLLCPQSEKKECAILEISESKDNKRLFFYSTNIFNEYKQKILSLISNEYNLAALDESELKGQGILCNYCYGISFSPICIFVLDKLDKNGIILLGIARALNKTSLLLRNEKLSMWDGDFKLLRTSTLITDIESGIRNFLKKYRT